MSTLIAISAKGENEKSQVDDRFGRCSHFIICDEKAKNYTSTKNPSSKASGGAGVSAVEFLSENNVKVVITGNVGPKAMRALQAANIEVYDGTGNSVEEAVKSYLEGKLKKVDEPTV